LKLQYHEMFAVLDSIIKICSFEEEVN
jgi:hypothetical protein